MSVLFLHMPFASPTVPSLAVETLAATLRRACIPADTFYGTLRFPRTPRIEAMIHSAAGEVIFTPLVFPECHQEFVVEQFLACDRAVGELAGNYGRLFGAPGDALPDISEIASEVRTHMALAERWVEDCLRAIPPGRYGTYAFSVSFDAQRMASLALAARLKEREPSSAILFGGTAVDGVMGQELLRAFLFIDVVSQGDADWKMVDLARALEGGENLGGRARPAVAARRGD